MMKNNYKEFDYQTIVVKKEKSQDIVNKYEHFGWVKFEEKQHSQYENLLEVEFYRPHKIKHKDALQFLQVNMEANIINQGRLEKRKHSKSLITGITLGVVGIICAFDSILAFLHMKPLSAIILGSLFAFVSLLSLILIPITLKRLIKKEKKYYDQKQKEYTTSISEIINKAKEFMEDKNE